MNETVKEFTGGLFGSYPKRKSIVRGNEKKMIKLTVSVVLDANNAHEAEELLDTIMANGIDAAIMENGYSGKDIRWEVLENNETATD